MNIIDLYIGKNFLKYLFICLLIPTVLFSFMEFLSQLDSVGEGTYTVFNALFFVVLTTPKRMLDLLPISALLGGIVALGRLADHCELVAMEACGISMLRISSSVLGACLAIMLLAGIAGDTVIPALERCARLSRAKALSTREITPVRKGLWARRKDSYIHIHNIIGRRAASDIDIFEFDMDRRLKAFIHANRAVIEKGNRWILKGVTRKTVRDNRYVSTDRINCMELRYFLSAEQVGAFELPPDCLSTPDLMQYIDVLRENGQNTDRYMLALWRKFSVPLTTCVMAILSLTFVFGSTREISAGLRITMGSVIGMVLYFFDQISVYVGLLLSLPPLAIAMTPVAVVSGIAFMRLRRIHH